MFLKTYLQVQTIPYISFVSRLFSTEMSKNNIILAVDRIKEAQCLSSHNFTVGNSSMPSYF